jgi:hypothetical protein
VQSASPNHEQSATTRDQPDSLSAIARRFNAEYTLDGESVSVELWASLRKPLSYHPQIVADTLVNVSAAEPSPALAVLASDALAVLARCEGWSVTGTIAYTCETCGAAATMRRRRRYACDVLWAFSYEPAADLTRETIFGLLAGAPPTRTNITPRPDLAGRVWITRRLLVCERCTRIDLHRCEHADDAGQCGEIVRGAHAAYCERHRQRSARTLRDTPHARRTGALREAPTWGPQRVIDFDTPPAARVGSHSRTD